jgi:hypothetical protein
MLASISAHYIHRHIREEEKNAMKATVLGVSEVFRGDSSKRTGKPYHGQQIHLAYGKRGIDGQAVMTQYVDFIGLDIIPSYKPGDTVSLDFDADGRLLEIAPAVAVAPKGFGATPKV